MRYVSRFLLPELSVVQFRINKVSYLVFALGFKQDVINVSKKYLPGMAKGFFSPKLTLNVGDGFEFMKKNQNAFDVIITDSSDPVGKQRKTSYLTPDFLN